MTMPANPLTDEEAELLILVRSDRAGEILDEYLNGMASLGFIHWDEDVSLTRAGALALEAWEKQKGAAMTDQKMQAIENGVSAAMERVRRKYVLLVFDVEGGAPSFERCATNFGNAQELVEAVRAAKTSIDNPTAPLSMYQQAQRSKP